MSNIANTGRCVPEQDLGKDEQYRLLFEANPTPMWVHDQETLEFLAVNDAALRLYGYSRQEFLALKLEQLRPPPALSALLEPVGTTGQEQAEPSTFLRHCKKDGALMDLELVISSVTFQGRGAWLALAHDVTERRFAEEVLRLAREQLEVRVQARTADLAALNEALVESQDRFRQMAENIRDVFWLANPSMTSIIYVSPAFQEIWGRPCDELYSNPRCWHEAIHAEDRPRQRQIFRKPIPSEGYQCAYRVVRPDGSTRWVLDRGFPVRDHAGRFYRLAGIARDVTESKELEKEVLAISEQEQRRIGQDLHDHLCQQIVGIEFLSKALQQQLGTQPQAGQAGEIAAAARVAIEQGRLLARGLIPIDVEAGGLMRGLQSLAAQMTGLFRIHCSFQCPTAVAIHDVTIGTSLYRIAQEAVNNGIKHGKASQIEIRLSSTGEGAELAVKDNGVGFSGQKGNSRGLGLRSMRYRADLIGASFGIQSEPERGTLVLCRVALPQTHDKSPSPTITSQPPREAVLLSSPPDPRR
ncbi:hypothetical protein SBV1_1580014 [Verrucomicrobia bacterium]|nr:hypothetical protein SBV1_1580014 [Verrucomicrobiota bacterium]